jgi:hypothetical protein
MFCARRRRPIERQTRRFPVLCPRNALIECELFYSSRLMENKRKAIEKRSGLGDNAGNGISTPVSS